jgi:hypothetical protein
LIQKVIGGIALDNHLSDFDTHYIEGYARMAESGSGYFKVPLFSQITDLLWTGGNPEDYNCMLDYVNEDGKNGLVIAKVKFDAILNLYTHERYDVPPSVDYKEMVFYDGADIPSEVELEEAVSWVYERLSKGLRVLVHCQAGLNRSGLVAALVLRRWYGMQSWEAIKLLRDSRCDVVLCNSHFQKYLLELDG